MISLSHCIIHVHQLSNQTTYIIIIINNTNNNNNNNYKCSIQCDTCLFSERFLMNVSLIKFFDSLSCMYTVFSCYRIQVSFPALFTMKSAK